MGFLNPLIIPRNPIYSCYREEPRMKEMKEARPKREQIPTFFLGLMCCSLPLPFTSFLIELITLAWQNIIRIKQHTMQSADPPLALFPLHFPPSLRESFLLRFSCWFIFLLMKQLLPGGIMTIIIIMRHAKVAVKASCKIIFRWQLFRRQLPPLRSGAGGAA